MNNVDMEKKVKELLRKMTLEEKLRQLMCISPEKLLEGGKFSRQKAKRFITDKGIGGVGPLLRSFSPREGARIANELQRIAREETRLGIPIIIHDECLHGCMAKGSTSFPQAIGLASMWEVELVEKIAAIIGRETRARGILQALSPTVNIARDVRCGRTEETYGEDPYLASAMAVSFVKGLQSEGVIATPKHFVANFVGDGGRDSFPIHFSERILREIYFPAFESAIKEGGALSIMAAYNSLDGIPCSCNRWLLTDILRKEWGFKGFVVSDYSSVVHIYEKHRVVENKAEAGKRALLAGLDMELPDIDCFGELLSLARKGEIPSEIIDESVARILRVKFWLGLFDNPFADPERAERLSDAPEHRKLALEASRKSMVLLKNEGFLPLPCDLKKIAVIGPNADEIRLGGYSGFGMKVVTPLEGIKNAVSTRTEVDFSPGCTVKDTSREGFKEALRIAEKADAVILVMGNNSGFAGEVFTEGEGNDRCNLDLPGVQEELIKEVVQVNPRVAVVLINGSAITMGRWIDKVPAVLEAWYPGEEGGNAIAEVLFGICNPGGKLPLTFPRFTGQLPLYYNYKPSGRGYDYTDLRGKQTLFPFGHGLSYTSFKYENLAISKSNRRNLEIKVSLEIANEGEYEGEEVVQLYLRDEVSSLARPLKELKGFRRVRLKPGEKKRVEFVLREKDLSFLNENLKPVLEPGTFEIMLGSSSEDIRLRGEIEI